MDALRKAKRSAFGVACPECKVKRPKAHPSILLPRQRCKVDGYRDPRPELTTDQMAEGLAPYGITVRDCADQEKNDE